MQASGFSQIRPATVNRSQTGAQLVAAAKEFPACCPANTAQRPDSPCCTFTTMSVQLNIPDIMSDIYFLHDTLVCSHEAFQQGRGRGYFRGKLACWLLGAQCVMKQRLYSHCTRVIAQGDAILIRLHLNMAYCAIKRVPLNRNTQKYNYTLKIS